MNSEKNKMNTNVCLENFTENIEKNARSIERIKNNESVKKCRDKQKKEEEARKLKIKKLKEDNAALETNIQSLTSELYLMTKIVMAHAEAAGETAMKNDVFVKLLTVNFLTMLNYVIKHSKLFIHFQISCLYSSMISF